MKQEFYTVQKSNAENWEIGIAVFLTPWAYFLAWYLLG